MSQCKPAPTLVTTSGKLCADDSSPYPDSTIYRCLAGALNTLPSLVWIFPTLFIKFICLYMILESLIWLLFIAFFDIFRVLFIMVCNYISPSFLLYCHIWMLIGVDVLTPVVLPLATVYLGDNLVSLFAKRQPTVSKSSSEVEYRGVANVVFETC